MPFHAWTLIYLIAGFFCLWVGLIILIRNPKPWSRRFMFGMLFIFALWPILEFLMHFSGDEKIAELLYEVDILILSFAFFFFLLIPYSFIKSIKRSTFLIFLLPIFVDIILLTQGGVLTGVEFGEKGVVMEYNVPIFLFWCTMGIVIILLAYVLFYMTLKVPDLEEDYKRRITIFCLGCGITVMLAYFLDTFGTIIFGLPPLGSAGAAVGMAIASSVFKR